MLDDTELEQLMDAAAYEDFLNERVEMHRYIPNTEADLACMLDRLGLSSAEDLFSDIPGELPLRRDWISEIL